MSAVKKDREVISSNISILRKRVCVGEEQLDISARQLARAILQSGDKRGPDEAYETFCRLFENADHRTKVEACRQISVCPDFAHQLAQKHLFGYGEPALPGTHGRISYVRNKKNDAAFLAFSERVRSAKAYYCSSFSEACETVFNNVCEFCILPVENDTDGKLYSFYAMIDRYELIISDVVYISGDDGADRTGFALVSRGGCIPKGGGAEYRMEFSIVCEETVFPESIAYAARLLGGTVRAVGTQPALYDATGNKYYFFVDIDADGVIPMAFYISAEYPRYTPLGLYQLKK